MARKPKRRRPAPDEPTEQISPQLRERIAFGQHVHVAEIHGESETRHLTRWARRSVLTR